MQEAAAEEEFGAKLTPINNKRDFEALIQGNRPVVVDFMAPWCGKCRMIAPFVDELAEKHPNMVSWVVNHVVRTAAEAGDRQFQAALLLCVHAKVRAWSLVSFTMHCFEFDSCGCKRWLQLF
jgi:thiol-disulfide isomerase/thioredoxin